jgi:hypothetical protein
MSRQDLRALSLFVIPKHMTQGNKGSKDPPHTASCMRRCAWFAVFISLLAVLSSGGGAERAAPSESSADDWPAYGRDPGGTRYSPLAQITRDNVTQLKVAWTYRTGEADRKAVSGGRAAWSSSPPLKIPISVPSMWRPARSYGKGHFWRARRPRP